MQRCITKPINRNLTKAPPGPKLGTRKLLRSHEHSFSISFYCFCLWRLCSSFSAVNSLPAHVAGATRGPQPPCVPVTAPATLPVSVFLSSNPKFPEKRFHLPSLVQAKAAEGRAMCIDCGPSNAPLWAAGREGAMVGFADIPKASASVWTIMSKGVYLKAA